MELKHGANREKGNFLSSTHTQLWRTLKNKSSSISRFFAVSFTTKTWVDEKTIGF